MLKNIKDWCYGKSALIRFPILIFCIYIAYRHFESRSYSSILFGLNLGIHEMGHFLFFWTTEVLYVAGGTILELFVPILSIYLFLRQYDYFAIAFCGVWLATNIYYVSMYLGDARMQQLPLISIGGGESKHDFTYLLGHFGIINYDIIISNYIRIFGHFVMWSSILFMIWLLYEMSKSPITIKLDEKY